MSELGPEDHAAWLEWRRGGIGASDVAVIVGLSDWGGRWELWAEKTGRIEPERIGDDVEERFWWGHELEASIAKRFGLKTGLVAVCTQDTFEHPHSPHHRATLDGTVGDGIDVFGPLEVKTDGSRSPWREVPDKYEVQVQWQMHVTFADRAWIAALFAGQKLEVYEVERDQGAIDLLVKAVDQFWNEHVVADEAPVPDARDLPAIKSFWPESTVGLEVDLEEEHMAMLEARASAKATEKAAEKQVKAIDAQLLERVADAEILTFQGRTVATWKTAERTTVGKELRVDHPAIAQQYLKTTKYRTLRPRKGASVE